jgi:hypothetical protein
MAQLVRETSLALLRVISNRAARTQPGVFQNGGGGGEMAGGLKNVVNPDIGLI